jgi:enolase
LVINVRWIKDLKFKAYSGAILKVNQTGSLYDAIKFADDCTKNNNKILTSHRSEESSDAYLIYYNCY